VFPEDRVLVGVIKRKIDLDMAQRDHWYRIPQGRASKGIHAEYIAFFLSHAFKDLNGGIHYYAERTGVELARRRDLLPQEAGHPRADALYYKVQLGELCRKDPPILNPTRRRFAFIYTTGDRFVEARVLADLYSRADHFVDRVFHALEARGVRAEQVWEASRESDDGGAQIRVLCEDGIVIASTAPRDEHVIPLVISDAPNAVKSSIETLREEIQRRGGLHMSSIPIEH
jgi:hypothetical protein